MIEMLVGLHVTNDSDYAKYRSGMTPILESFGGGFGYDFKIAEVLKSETKHIINRVFTIHFPNKEKMEAFFSNIDYKRVKDNHFIQAVESTTIMATYHRT